MLSLMVIVRVGPYFVLMVACRLLLSSFISRRFFLVIPLLCAMSVIASSHALSYALLTSRNAMWIPCFAPFHFAWFIIEFRIIMWSAVDFRACPPAWVSVIFITFFIRLFIILSNSLAVLLARVMPLSLLHFPFVPFPL